MMKRCKKKPKKVFIILFDRFIITVLLLKGLGLTEKNLWEDQVVLKGREIDQVSREELLIKREENEQDGKTNSNFSRFRNSGKPIGTLWRRWAFYLFPSFRGSGFADAFSG